MYLCVCVYACIHTYTSIYIYTHILSKPESFTNYLLLYRYSDFTSRKSCPLWVHINIYVFMYS